MLRAWTALDIPDLAGADDTCVPDMVRRAQLLARMNPWLVLYQLTCNSAGAMSFQAAGELAQDADREAIGDMGDGYAESALALDLQLERLRWVHSNLIASRGPVWNPPADLAIGYIEGIGRLIESWRAVFHQPTDPAVVLADGTPAGRLDPDLLRQGYERIVAALDALNEAAQRVDTGEIIDNQP